MFDPALFLHFHRKQGVAGVTEVREYHRRCVWISLPSDWGTLSPRAEKAERLGSSYPPCPYGCPLSLPALAFTSLFPIGCLGGQQLAGS